jgi:hypothetical protein
MFLKHGTSYAQVSSIRLILYGHSGTSFFSDLIEIMTCTLQLLHVPLIGHSNFTQFYEQV